MLQFELAGLLALQRELDRIFSKLNQHEGRAKFSNIRNDIFFLREGYNKAISHFKEVKTGSLLDAQIAETRASTRLALTVNRLTKLAFIFIPLSFTASFFGMNIAEWGQGTIALRTFFITAVVIGTGTIIPILPSILRVLIGSTFWENALVCSKLARRTPSQAFWYAGLCLLFEPAIVMSLCGSDLSFKLNVRRRVSVPKLRQSAAADRMQRSNYSDKFVEFWKTKALDLEEFAETL